MERKKFLPRRTIVVIVIAGLVIVAIAVISLNYQPYYSSITSDSTWSFFDADTTPSTSDERIHPTVPVIPEPNPPKKIKARRSTKGDSVEIDLEIIDSVAPDIHDGLRPFPTIEPPMTIVERGASYPGGTESFKEFLQSSIKYPIRASRNETEGRVYVEFIVEKNGRLSEVKSIKGIGDGCDEEAVRVVSTSRPWRPALHQGDTVRQKIVFPVDFDLPKRRKSKK